MNKRLTRNKSNGKIFGVCSGLGDYFRLDPVIFRILFILSTIFGAGILIYIVCLIIMSKV
jgi:phage shock protein C